jgi:hypothetical protein
VEVLSAVTVALAAVAVIFAWWTVRLGLEAAREVRSDQIVRRIEQIGAAIEAIYVSDDPANPTGIAQDRLHDDGAVARLARNNENQPNACLQ